MQLRKRLLRLGRDFLVVFEDQRRQVLVPEATGSRGNSRLQGADRLCQFLEFYGCLWGIKFFVCRRWNRDFVAEELASHLLDNCGLGQIGAAIGHDGMPSALELSHGDQLNYLTTTRSVAI